MRIARVCFSTTHHIDRKGARHHHPQHHRTLCSSTSHTPYSTSQSHRSYIVSTHPQDADTTYKVSDLSYDQPIPVSPTVSPLSTPSSSPFGSPSSSTPPQLWAPSHHAVAFVYVRTCIVWNMLSPHPIPVRQFLNIFFNLKKNVKKTYFLPFLSPIEWSVTHNTYLTQHILLPFSCTY